MFTVDGSSSSMFVPTSANDLPPPIPEEEEDDKRMNVHASTDIEDLFACSAEEHQQFAKEEQARACAANLLHDAWEFVTSVTSCQPILFPPLVPLVQPTTVKGRRQRSPLALSSGVADTALHAALPQQKKNEHDASLNLPWFMSGQGVEQLVDAVAECEDIRLLQSGALPPHEAHKAETALNVRAWRALQCIGLFGWIYNMQAFDKHDANDDARYAAYMVNDPDKPDCEHLNILAPNPAKQNLRRALFVGLRTLGYCVGHDCNHFAQYVWLLCNTVTSDFAPQSSACHPRIVEIRQKANCFCQKKDLTDLCIAHNHMLVEVGTWVKEQESLLQQQPQQTVTHRDLFKINCAVRGIDILFCAFKKTLSQRN